MQYLYSNVNGCHVLDGKFKIVSTLEFKNFDDAMDALKSGEYTPEEKKALEDNPEIMLVNPKKDNVFRDGDKRLKIIANLEKKHAIAANKRITASDLSASVIIDHTVIQTVSALEEMDKIINGLTKRLREWYGPYFPELCEKITDHQKYVELSINALENGIDKLLKELGYEQTFGAEISEPAAQAILSYAKIIIGFYDEREVMKKNLEKIMKKHYPHIEKTAGYSIGARLIASAGSLRKIAIMPSSTIQLLGAEKALFRHLVSGSRVPKHGLIVNHTSIADKKRSERGKAARMLANKISIAARVDYYRVSK
ncbi:NOP58 family protein [Candidatus Woesearchaeota archaeon]|nr:NOP58 family protein [Candidatus Woesearchaeota archaeon]